MVILDQAALLRTPAVGSFMVKPMPRSLSIAMAAGRQAKAKVFAAI